MTTEPRDYEILEIPDFRLAHGSTLRPARLAYKTYGSLNAERSNAIVYPTWYSGRHWDNEWLIGPGMALDPERYFIIIPNMFGNGLSSSPSNTPAPTTAAGSRTSPCWTTSTPSTHWSPNTSASNGSPW
ncbi:hypothetical protein [Sciscionella marina]|uniref:hypothetical protein n=1 Tax=Sciscionella marina TaxID=508770 RepID=UPI0003A576B5|nr:hypothetical protein [Sciscionella marina]